MAAIQKALRALTATPTLSAAGLYASGDYVGTTATPISLLLAVRGQGYQSGTIRTITLVDKAANTTTTEVWFFNATLTTPTDNAAWSISDADALKFVGAVSLATAMASGANSVYTAANVNLAFTLPSGTTLFAALVTRGTPTYTTGDLQLTVLVEPD